MKQRKQMVLRIVAGLVLLLVAAGITVVIRDTLASQNPERALPTMDVYYRGKEVGERLPAAHITVGKYTWRFLFTEVKDEVFKPENLGTLESAWVPPNSLLELDFSFKPKDVQVSLFQEDDGGNSFVPQELAGLRAPSAKGIYFYKVATDWGNGREVIYFFAIQVPSW